MESIQSIKKRVRSVNNIAQITKAMEMVSANKMRRSQEATLASRPYALTALELLHALAKRSPLLPPLMRKHLIRNILVLLVSADKGLAGSLNSNVFRQAEKHIKELEKTYPDATFSFAAVGKKSEEFLLRKNNSPVIAFTGFGDYAETEETKPLADFLIAGYETNDWDQVFVISTHFRTTLRQDVIFRELLPISEDSLKKTIKELTPEYGRYSKDDSDIIEVSENHIYSAGGGSAYGWEYLIEPAPQLVLEALTRYLIEMAVYHLVLEANASEHSARMVAMKNASDNATDLKDELSLLYNKSRQAGITREIAEISAGAESLNNS